MDADSTDIFSSVRRCSYCSDSCDDCPAPKGDEESGLLQILFQTPTSSTGSLCCTDESGNNESDSDVGHESCDNTNGLRSAPAFEEASAPRLVSPVDRGRVGRIVRQLTDSYVPDSVRKIIKIMIIVATVCLLCSIAIFLCALSDKYCLIPASCLLTIGVVCFTTAFVLKMRGVSRFTIVY
ncbi:hypothetical protein [Candidatus Ichthyocystis hellenicum]|uniref:hypothetical protein n=1 Tax=Candidatus Ichthyocystis hellenicum TaxID=1561003 RepID=UPI000B847BBF|nr:hypothetical protein [Candidatus Ichthyocystis hellenicum]